jgi:hypothetical protein
MDVNRSLFDRCFHILHNQIYKPYFGKNFKDLEINKTNFDTAPKGTGVFYCDKKIFLTSQILNKEDKDASDDTKLLKNVLDKTKIILKTSKFKVIYLTRTNLLQNLNHIYHRGPKFIDFFFNKGKAYYNYILIFLIFLIMMLLSLFIKPKLFFFYLITALILNIIISVYLSKSLKDLIATISIMPLIVSLFGIGIVKGIVYKIIK